MTLIPTRTISLDIGTHLGWAEALDGVIVRSGTILVKDTNDRWGKAMVNLWDFLTRLVYDSDRANYTLEFAYEIVNFHKSVHSAHAYGRILGQIEKFTEVGGWAFTSYNVGKIKQIFTGRGNAKKLDICQRCHELGWQGGKVGTDNDNDEADAVAILFVHLEARNETATFAEEQKHDYEWGRSKPGGLEAYGGTW
jgi:Holliday junction resolvasome RuvABC endonuclease subunit